MKMVEEKIFPTIRSQVLYKWSMLIDNSLNHIISLVKVIDELFS